jgi:hypothetical protein
MVTVEVVHFMGITDVAPEAVEAGGGRLVHQYHDPSVIFADVDGDGTNITTVESFSKLAMANTVLKVSAYTRHTFAILACADSRQGGQPLCFSWCCWPCPAC